MFTLNIRFQIAAMLVLLTIVIDYIKNPHLKLNSSRYFRIMLGTTAVNLTLDMITVYTVTHLDRVPMFWNRVFHQLFYASVIFALFFEYLYIRMLANNQKRLEKKEALLSVIPLAVSVIIILRGDVYYYSDGVYAYSYGPLLPVIYICGLLYLIMVFKLISNKHGYVTPRQRSSVVIGCIIWITVLAVQAIFPRFLLSGLGFVLMILAFYFSEENQKENFDSEAECFNRNAFHKMLAENYARKKPLYVVTLTCRNIDRVFKIAGREKGIQALVCLKEAFTRHTGKEVYHSSDKCLSIFFQEDIRQEIEKLHELELELKKEEYSDVQMNCFVSVLDVRKYTASWTEVDDLLDFLTDRMQGNECKICFLNEEIIKEKQRRDKIDALLDEAIAGDGFEMVYQPIYNSKEKKFTSAEALIRLKNCGELGFVSPEEFIPLAEEKGLINEIGDRALELVAQMAKEKNLVGSPIKYIEVNLSAIQAVIPHLDKRLERIIDRYGIPASFINLEITETATVNFGATFEKNISSLRALGFSFSMDDFGTGYSNIAQMNRIKYDLVKLDKSLIWPVFETEEDGIENEKAEQLLASAISLIKSIGMKIVAEGVETEEMVNYLVEHGVDYLQGYYYSRPIPADQFIQFLKDRNDTK